MLIKCAGKINDVEPGNPVEVDDEEARFLIGIGYASQVEAKAKPETKRAEDNDTSPAGKE